MLEQKEPPEAPPEVLATTSVGDESQEETESAFGVLGQKNEGERKAEEFKVRTAEGSTGVSGEKFLQDYYHCLSNNLEKLSNFYHVSQNRQKICLHQRNSPFSLKEYWNLLHFFFSLSLSLSLTHSLYTCNCRMTRS